MQERIFIRSTNWIGDAVMSLAAVREIRRLHPRDRLTLAARRWVAGVFEGQGLVDDLIILEPQTSRLAGFLSLVRQARGHRRAILLPNSFESALTVWAAGIPERIGYALDGRTLLLTRRARPRIKALERHQVYYYLDLLYQTGLSDRDYLNDPLFEPDLRLSSSEAAAVKADDLLKSMGAAPSRPLVAIHPGAFFGSAKRWFPDRYAALADRLIGDLGAEVLILGSADDAPLAEQIRARMKHLPRLLAGATEVAELMALIRRCRLFITNDSGPMHLAAALGAPQIALFGSTDERATGPFSEHARVIHKHVECSPCLLRECPSDLRCFSRIEVDEVFDLARSMLGELAASASEGDG
jgi:heptosyltransferase-2